MPIKSYLAHPHEGQKEELINALKAFEDCDIIPAKNQDLVIVVTDTPTQQEDDLIKEKIEAIDSLRLLAMVSGFNTPQND
ncbi:hypothetical protein [Aquimarina rhabdastrellae]